MENATANKVETKSAKRTIKVAKAVQAKAQITTKVNAKNRVQKGARLSMEAHCLLLVQQGKGYKEVLALCKRKYAEKDPKTLPKGKTMQEWIAARAKVYTGIAIEHLHLLGQEERKANNA